MHTFSFAPSARRKMVDLLYGALKTCQPFKVSVVLPPPLEKFLRAPMDGCVLVRAFDMKPLNAIRKTLRPCTEICVNVTRKDFYVTGAVNE